MDDIKNLIKIAGRVQDALVKLRRHHYIELLNQLKSFSDKLVGLSAQAKKLGISLAHSWFFAAEDSRNSIRREVSELTYSLSRTQEFVEKPTADTPNLSLLVEELKQLQQEFGDIAFDKEADTISVETEKITLDDVYLGPFKIQLELKKLAELYRGPSYYCIALDPHPAATNDDVTHPHVSGDRLCEGEGSVAIRTALEQGRLCDFFTLVKSILNTYSPDSPYVALADWEGEPCYDCGYVMDSDNRYYCGSCDQSYCEHCSTYCKGCEETVCLGCAGECEVCGDMVCHNCAHKCAECGKYCCESCIEENVCQNCITESEVQNEQQSNPITTTDKDSNDKNSNSVGEKTTEAIKTVSP
jgi:hypothetical protein